MRGRRRRRGAGCGRGFRGAVPGCRGRGATFGRADAGTEADRGSGTVLVLVHLTVLLLLGAALGAVAAVVVQHRAAQAAAELAALAAAADSASGGCPAAAEVARANGARVTACRTRGLEVDVEVAVPPPAWPPGLPALVAEARAGPG